MSVTERIRINLLANYFRNFSKQRFKTNCYQKCIKEIANIARVTNLTRTASCSRNLVANICRNFRARFRFALIGRNLTAQSKGSHRGSGGGIQIPNSCYFFFAIFVSECLTKSSCASFFVEIAKKNKASKFLLVGSILGISLLESHGKLQSYFL